MLDGGTPYIKVILITINSLYLSLSLVDESDTSDHNSVKMVTITEYTPSLLKIANNHS